MSVRHRKWYAFVHWFLRATYFSTHGGIRAVNPENVPETGGVLIAPLHISHLDPPAVACAMKRQLRFMAKEELFKNPFFGWLITSIGAYPVKRGETDSESIRTTIALLEAGEAVIIFPEGTRGDGLYVQEMSRGVAMLAKRTKVPVVPVGVIGTNIVMPKGKTKGNKCEVVISYGKPFTYEEVATSASDKENRVIFAKELQKRIAELSGSNGVPLKTLPSRLDSASSPGPA